MGQVCSRPRWGMANRQLALFADANFARQLARCARLGRTVEIYASGIWMTMQKLLRWVGWLFCTAGAVAISAFIAMTFRGLPASFNFGDPSKFEFILVPFWQIGLVIIAIGGTCVLISRRWR
jgi:hypothetical protein